MTDNKKNGVPMDDIVHIALIAMALVCYTVLNLLGHTDPTQNNALLGVATFFGGSYARNKSNGA